MIAERKCKLVISGVVGQIRGAETISNHGFVAPGCTDLASPPNTERSIRAEKIVGHRAVNESSSPRPKKPLTACRNLTLTKLYVKAIAEFPCPPIVEKVDGVTTVAVTVKLVKVCQTPIECTSFEADSSSFNIKRVSIGYCSGYARIVSPSVDVSSESMLAELNPAIDCQIKSVLLFVVRTNCQAFVVSREIVQFLELFLGCFRARFYNLLNYYRKPSGCIFGFQVCFFWFKTLEYRKVCRGGCRFHLIFFSSLGFNLCRVLCRFFRFIENVFGLIERVLWFIERVGLI